SGKPFTAGELLSRAESIVEREQGASGVDRLNRLVAIGEQYRYLDRKADAMRVLTQAYDNSRAQPHPHSRARAACELALATMRAGQRERSESLFKEGIAALPDEPQYRSAQITCLLDGSMVAREFSRPNDALDRARAAQALLPQLPYPSATTELRVFTEIADSNRMAGNLPAAIAAFQEVSTRLAELGRGETLEAASVYNNWAMALNFTGQMRQAEELFRRAMRIESADGTDKNVSTMVLTNLARVLIELDRLDEAQRYADRAHARAQAEGNEVVVRDANFLRARIDVRRGEFAQASKLLDDVETRYRKPRPPDCVCYASLDYERAKMAVASRDSQGALAAMDRAVARAEQKSSTPDALRYFLLRRAEVEL